MKAEVIGLHPDRTDEFGSDKDLSCTATVTVKAHSLEEVAAKNDRLYSQRARRELCETFLTSWSAARNPRAALFLTEDALQGTLRKNEGGERRALCPRRTRAIPGAA